MYRYGNGVEQNYKIALKYYDLSAKQGNNIGEENTNSLIKDYNIIQRYLSLEEKLIQTCGVLYISKSSIP